MTKYKRVYGLNLIFMVIEMSVILEISFLAFIIIPSDSIGIMLGLFSVDLLCFSGVIAVFAAAILLINLIAHSFSSYTTELDEFSIIHGQETARLSDIRSIMLDLGRASRSSPRPQTITLITSTEQEIRIIGPSPRLIKRLKTLCTNASFEIDNIRKRLIIDAVITLMFTVIFTLFAIMMK